jgi:hypothetical protein
MVPSLFAISRLNVDPRLNNAEDFRPTPFVDKVRIMAAQTRPALSFVQQRTSRFMFTSAEGGLLVVCQKRVGRESRRVKTGGGLWREHASAVPLDAPGRGCVEPRCTFTIANPGYLGTQQIAMAVHVCPSDPTTNDGIGSVAPNLATATGNYALNLPPQPSASTPFATARPTLSASSRILAVFQGFPTSIRKRERQKAT